MHPLEERIAHHLQQLAITPGQRWLIGTSGGPDSTALLWLLAALKDRLPLGLTACYVDHGLRPNETAAERELVKQQAAALQIPFVSGTVSARDYAAENRLSLEHGCRDLRYALLHRMARECGAVKIAVAHTADDQVEEILLRFLRGCGLAGLAGMAGTTRLPIAVFENDFDRFCHPHTNSNPAQGHPTDDRPQTPRHIDIIRPLLTTAKQELLDYLEHRRLAFCSDSSNTDRRFVRNRIRLDLLPLLQGSFNPNICQTLLRSAHIFRDEDTLLTDLTTEALADCWQPATAQAAGSLLRRPFLAAHPALQRRILEQLLWRLGCRPTAEQIDTIRALIADSVDGKMHLAGGLRLQARGDTLSFDYPHGRMPHRKDGSHAAGRCDFYVTMERPGTANLTTLNRRLIIRQTDSVPSPQEMTASSDQFLDAATVSFPLTIRPPRPGDRFQPLGAPGSKKVADFFTDHKIPAANRALTPLLVTADGTIAALIGLRINHHCRITPQTRQVLRITATEG